MSSTLSPRHEAVIRQLVEGGSYADPDAVVDEALQALRERDRLTRLRAAIAIGDAQLVRGEGIPYTEALLDAIDQEVDERLPRGDQPSADVHS